MASVLPPPPSRLMALQEKNFFCGFPLFMMFKYPGFLFGTVSNFAASCINLFCTSILDVGFGCIGGGSR